MAETDSRERAIELWNEGCLRHQRAIALAESDRADLACTELNAAIELYSESLTVCPTAEAYTFRGWAYRSFGRIDDAIAECKHAIELDPEYGNPYNDIGAYLIAKGDLDEAITWLEKAKTAPRYEPRHFPYMNLGRLYAAKGMILKAIEEFEAALEIEADEPSCLKMIAEL